MVCCRWWISCYIPSSLPKSSPKSSSLRVVKYRCSRLKCSFIISSYSIKGWKADANLKANLMSGECTVLLMCLINPLTAPGKAKWLYPITLSNYSHPTISERYPKWK